MPAPQGKGSQIAQFIPLPAPSKGMNAIANLSQMDPAEAIYCINMLPTQAGVAVRPGYSDWVEGFTDTGGIRTIITVRGSGASGTYDKIFACTIKGIYDVTSIGAPNTPPSLAVTFGNQSGNAGYCEYDSTTNNGGNSTLLVCDEVNGYYTYDFPTSTWTKVTLGAGAGQVSNVDPATFVSVRVFNNFVWFVQAGSGNAWYLPINQIYGAATSFGFSNKTPHGGNLNNLYIFTYGSYFGMYLYLVFVGDSGDVLAYSGTNPASSTTWTLSGQWYVGDMPAGRRNASNYGGDLLILSNFGGVMLSSLFYQKSLDDPNTFLTKKINPALAQDIANYGSIRGWQIVPWPAINSILIILPVVQGASRKSGATI
jgi:hypothetical protein